MDDPASTGQTLLLVEDNEDNRIIYCTVLRHLGYEVIEAQDGVQAVELARAVQPDLILMDISIPRMDGWEATRILRDDPRTSAIPIIALTAHALADDRERGSEVEFQLVSRQADRATCRRRRNPTLDRRGRLEEAAWRLS